MIIIDLFENLISPPNGSINYYIWYYALIVSNYGSDFLRCCWIALCIERGVATYFKHEYEQKSFSVVAIVLTLLIHLIAIGVICLKLKFPFSDYTIFAVSISMDLAGCLSVFLIFQYNKFLLQTRYELKFSERFQVDENLRILKFLRPYLIVGIVLTLFNTLIRVLVYQITALSWIASRIVNIYFL
uniref:Uncharacterized protein n=1 Tax=Acrobeloides nanus TaxID=290746 RepID=A0A914DZ43_9BILA